MTTYNAFCNSLQTLPDGRIVMVGGNSDGSTSMSTMLYDPTTHAEVMGMAPSAPTPSARTHNHWWYPRAFNAPNGKVFEVSGDPKWQLDATGSGSLDDARHPAHLDRGIGCSRHVRPRQAAPGRRRTGFSQDSVTATNATTTIDISGTSPVVTSVSPMASRRNWLNLTVLPTGGVLTDGGTIVGTQAGASNCDYTAEIWNPSSQSGIPGPEDNLNAKMYRRT